MFIHKISIYAIFLAVAASAGCTKQTGLGPNYSDYNPGQTPIIVTNAVDYRPDPTVSTSLSGDSSITINLSLTGSSGKSMTQITNVIGASSYAPIQTATSKWYNAAPIAATNNSVTFKTSIAEYFSHYPVSASNPAAKANTELSNRFYFSITLNDGSIVYPTPVRVLVLP
ncbi:MAG TPA: hypothetical protein VNU70_10745 [Puia sp.]|nr:hypothetical protein [Puia sp.]